MRIIKPIRLVTLVCNKSIHADARHLAHLRPLAGFGGDEGAERFRRFDRGRGAELRPAACTASDLRASLITVLSRAITGAGVPAGATTPKKLVTT